MDSPFLKQLWLVSGVLMNMVAQGMVLSFASSLLPALEALGVDLGTASSIGSCIGLSGIPGLFLASFLMDLWGRKIAHALVILPGIIGWTFIYYASSVPGFLIGRILCGVTAGATVGIGAVVIGECTSPHHRGMFLNLKTASVCLGSMLVHICGNFVTYRILSLIAMIPQVLSLIIIMTWQESPAYLAAKKQFEKAEKSFYALRGKNEESIRELNKMIKAQMNEIAKENTTFKEDVVYFLKKFTRRDFLLPILIITCGCMLLEVSGRHLFPAYALRIIEEVTGNKSQSFYYTLAIDLIITLSATFSSVLVKIMKRRTLLFSTGSAAFVVLTIVCTYLFLASRDVISKERPWIPISLFVVYFVLVNLGCTPIPLAFLGEMLPLAHRGSGSAVGGVVLNFCVYAGLQATPLLLASVKVYGTFAVFGGIMAVLLIILFFIVPETKDKTLQEIEDHFNRSSLSDNANEDIELRVRMIADSEVKL